MNEAPPPPRWLVAAWIASLVLGLPALGFAYRYTKGWANVRMGKSGLEQRLTMLGPKPFKRSFLEFCTAVEQVVPEGERIFVEPYAIRSASGRARWYLYMNLELHPRQVIVRAPELASGTLVDYPRWLELHARGTSTLEAIQLTKDLEALDVDWRIRYPVTLGFPRGSAFLERRTASGWEDVELPKVRFAEGVQLDFGAEDEEEDPVELPVGEPEAPR